MRISRGTGESSRDRKQCCKQKGVEVYAKMGKQNLSFLIDDVD